MTHFFIDYFAYFVLFIGLMISVYLFIETSRRSKKLSNFDPLCQIFMQIGSAFAAATFGLCVVLIQLSIDKNNKNTEEVQRTILRLSADFEGNKQNLYDLKSKFMFKRYRNSCVVDQEYNKLGRFDLSSDMDQKLNEDEIWFISQTFFNNNLLSHKTNVSALLVDSDPVYSLINPWMLHRIKGNVQTVESYINNEEETLQNYQKFAKSLDTSFIENGSLIKSELEKKANAKVLYAFCNYHFAMINYRLDVVLAQINITMMECFYVAALTSNDDNLKMSLKTGLRLDGDVGFDNTIHATDKFASNLEIVINKGKISEEEQIKALEGAEVNGTKCSEIVTSMKDLAKSDLPIRGVVRSSRRGFQLRGQQPSMQ